MMVRAPGRQPTPDAASGEADIAGTLCRIQALRARIQAEARQDRAHDSVAVLTKYSVVWQGGGTLGITLTKNTGQRAAVSRIVPSGSTAVGLSNVRVGDVVVSINGTDVSNLPFQQTIDVLKAATKPTVLGFGDGDGTLASHGQSFYGTPTGSVRPTTGALPRRGVSSEVVTSAPALSTVYTTHPRSESRGGVGYAGTSLVKQPARPMAYGRSPTPVGGGGGGTPSPALSTIPWDKPCEGMPPCGPNQYDVLWEDGALGVVFQKAQAGYLPIVKRLSGKGTSCFLSRVSPGDALLGVNGIDCRALAFDDILVLLQRVPKPAVLRFQRPAAGGGGAGESSGESSIPSPHSGSSVDGDAYCYTVTWARSPLGITLREQTTEWGSTLPCVHRVTQDQLDHTAAVRVGDVLLTIVDANGVTTNLEGVEFSHAIALLRSAPRPVQLVFQACASRV